MSLEKSKGVLKLFGITITGNVDIYIYIYIYLVSVGSLSPRLEGENEMEKNKENNFRIFFTFLSCLEVLMK